MVKVMSAVLVSVVLVMFLWGCQKKEQPPTPGQPSKVEQPAPEQPAAEQPASEKPKSEHPEHPK